MCKHCNETIYRFAEIVFSTQRHPSNLQNSAHNACWCTPHSSAHAIGSFHETCDLIFYESCHPAKKKSHKSANDKKRATMTLLAEAFTAYLSPLLKKHEEGMNRSNPFLV